jgi:hypothetical protein
MSERAKRKSGILLIKSQRDHLLLRVWRVYGFAGWIAMASAYLRRGSAGAERAGPPRAAKCSIARPDSILPSAALFTGVRRVEYFRSVQPYVNAQIAGSAVLASRSTNPSIEIVYSLAWAR